jgi:hypothetical protein
LYPSLRVKIPEKGLKFEYYEDTSFSLMPDFQKMNSKKAGNADIIDLSVRERDTNYAIIYSGYIQIPESAVFTFFLSSDDGSKLYIDDSLCIDNDGLHGPLEIPGVCALEKGFHKIKVEFFQSGMGEYLALLYEAKEIGIKLNPVPGEILFH